jgi:hypothetical protein
MQMTASRHADLPDVPVAAEFAKDEDKRRVLELFVLRQKYGRPFLAPPGTPGPVIAAYHEAFDKLVHDPDFIREAERAQLIIKVASGAEVTALVNRIHDSPKSIIEEASALLRSFSE